MEKISISKEEYENMKMQISKLKELEENIDLDLMRQLMSSLKDIKEGRIERVK